MSLSNPNNQDQHDGQTVMNVLYEVWPEKYQEIEGSDFDCFYDYDTVQSTLNKLEKEWKL